MILLILMFWFSHKYGVNRLKKIVFINFCVKIRRLYEIYVIGSTDKLGISEYRID